MRKKSLTNFSFFLRMTLLTELTGAVWLLLADQLTATNLVKTTAVSLCLSFALVLVRFNQND